MEQKKTHTDPRILRTRQLIKGALIELLQEMELEKISVNRLAERATINRVTFYLHYRDIPDMLEKMAEDMIDEISIVLNERTKDEAPPGKGDWAMMVNFLEYIAGNAKFYKIVLASKQIPIFKDRLLSFLTEIIVKRIESRVSSSHLVREGIQDDILIWYNSSALIGTIIAWLRNDMPYTPSYLVKQFSMLHHRGLNKADSP
ncbi:TetR/AcrR family transcriptional regulator [Peribacillus kribbensis]|uniref:TetR/AcrR family transcriptional regulator n=1 Tax=Peribacillus kribbensis TaxID=356658 RepID=UPI000409C462|nr:TetR-like C-terminal domain-containing protein [Peribacillus kribbensis]